MENNTNFALQEGPKIYFEISVFSKKFAQFENKLKLQLN